MIKTNLTLEERIRVDDFPNSCPHCFSTNVTPTFDYEHDVINFHCNNCNNEYSSDEFVECGYCHELIHTSLAEHSDITGKDYCHMDCKIADEE